MTYTGCTVTRLPLPLPDPHAAHHEKPAYIVLWLCCAIPKEALSVIRTKLPSATFSPPSTTNRRSVPRLARLDYWEAQSVPPYPNDADGCGAGKGQGPTPTSAGYQYWDSWC